MNNIHRQIVKKANCNVLDLSFTKLETIERDIIKRLLNQTETLDNWRENWEGQEVVEKSVTNLEKTLFAIKELKKHSL